MNFEESEIAVLGEIVFPDGFNDAGGQTFQYTYDNLKDFVNFTRHWTAVTGLFKRWHRYVDLRDKKDKVDAKLEISSETSDPVFDVSQLK